MKKSKIYREKLEYGSPFTSIDDADMPFTFDSINKSCSMCEGHCEKCSMMDKYILHLSNITGMPPTVFMRDMLVAFIRSVVTGTDRMIINNEGRKATANLLDIASPIYGSKMDRTDASAMLDFILRIMRDMNGYKQASEEAVALNMVTLAWIIGFAMGSRSLHIKSFESLFKEGKDDVQ